MRFADPVADAQLTFRVLLEALARPAVPRVVPFAPAVCAVALTLLDRETPVWLGPGTSDELHETIAQGARAPIVDDPRFATFAFAHHPGAIPALDRFNTGTPADPESSATLFIAVEAFEGGIPAIVRGPGLLEARTFAPRGLPESFWASWDENARAFPQGIDVFFVCGDLVAGFPRTVSVKRSGVRAA